MLENIFAPVSDWGLLILRVALGILMIAHGWPKLNPSGRWEVRLALLAS